MDFSLTDEQHDFVAAIRDFCRRECGTQEQREKLTQGYTEAHNDGCTGRWPSWAGSG